MDNFITEDIKDTQMLATQRVEDFDKLNHLNG